MIWMYVIIITWLTFGLLEIALRRDDFSYLIHKHFCTDRLFLQNINKLYSIIFLDNPSFYWLNIIKSSASSEISPNEWKLHKL